MPSTNPVPTRERLIVSLDMPEAIAYNNHDVEVACAPNLIDLSAMRDKGASGRARIVADYVAGMTDRFAAKEQQRLAEDAT